MSLFYTMLRCKRAAGAAEFALVLPLMIGIVGVSLDLGSMWSTQLALEQAAQRAVERVLGKPELADNLNEVVTEATSAFGAPTTSATADLWVTCDGERQSSPTDLCAGVRARFVTVALEAEYMPALGWGQMLSGSTDNGSLPIRGDASVRLPS